MNRSNNKNGRERNSKYPDLVLKKIIAMKIKKI